MLDDTELIRRLVESNLARPSEIKGCSEKEVAKLEKKYGLVLPDSYRRFLLAAGKGAGRWMSDVDVFCKDVQELTSSVATEYSDVFRLPVGAFVFASRLGEVILFFVCDGKDDDPPVYVWKESYKRPKKMLKSVWQFFELELRESEG